MLCPYFIFTMLCHFDVYNCMYFILVCLRGPQGRLAFEDKWVSSLKYCTNKKIEIVLHGSTNNGLLSDF